MKLPIQISENSKEPIYHQVETQLKTLIVSGQLPPGTKLPSIRALSNDLACSVITTRRAYQNLENNGFIQTVQGRGTFVSELDEEMKDETKYEVVYSALLKAVEQGMLLGCTMDEIHSIFEKVVRREVSDNGEKGRRDMR